MQSILRGEAFARTLTRPDGEPYPVNGVILWTGESRIDGAPIAVIMTNLTRPSGNPKTTTAGGETLQTWILRADVEPNLATKTGQDASICGDCPHRGKATGSKAEGRSCYVVTHQAPLSVYRAFRRGAYPRVTPEQARRLVDGRFVRFGAYGDPGAAPLAVWRNLTQTARNWTGYTHQWRRFPGLKSMCMASVDDGADGAMARRQGWRTFRAYVPGSAHGMNFTSEITCPAVSHGRTCEQCGLCNGAGGAKSITIPVHGYGAKNAAANFGLRTIG